MVENKRILLTGGAGFIGTHLCQALHERNEIVVLDNLRRNARAGTALERSPQVELRQGDVRDLDAVRAAIDGCTHVIHLAAIAGVDTVMDNPVPTMQVNLLGASNVLEAAHARDTVERVVNFSTSEVFGSHAYNVSEGDVTSLGAVGEARWTYAVSKLATEHMAHTYYREFGLPTVAIRPFNIYGPGQVGEGAIHHFILRALKDEDLTIHNDGSQIRAWCYIDDIAEAVMRAISLDRAVGHSFNVGNPRSTLTIYNLAREIVRLAESRSKLEMVTWDHPDVELRIPDVTKARRLLGFEPRVDLEDGLKRTIAWYGKKIG